MQGVLVQGLQERCQFGGVSEGLMSSGPYYTYIKGEVRTAINYILLDLEAASMMTCQKHPMVDPNTSDNLAVSATLSLASGSILIKVNWLEVKKCGALEVYEREVRSKLDLS